MKLSARSQWRITRTGLFSGKSNEFIIVEFEGDASLIGQFVDVEIIDAMNWAVIGKII